MNEYYSSSPSFDVVEEIKVSHGMFVSSRQTAETFFHQIVPSQTVKVHLNPVTANTFSIENEETKTEPGNQVSFFRKFKAFVRGKLIQPSKTIAKAIIFIFAILLMNGVYLEEQAQNWIADSEDVKGKRQLAEEIKWNEEEKVWFVGVKSGKGFSVVLKKVGIFLSISLALCTMWANHITVNP